MKAGQTFTIEPMINAGKSNKFANWKLFLLEYLKGFREQEFGVIGCGLMDGQLLQLMVNGVRSLNTPFW